MTLKSDAKFKEELTCGFKYDMRNLVNFDPTTQNLKISFRWTLFVQSNTRFVLQKYNGIIFHNTEQ